MSIVERIVSVAKSQIGTCEPDGDDKYIKVYNEATGAKFGMNVAWCAIFVTWVMIICNVAKEVVLRFASCTAGMKWFIKQGRWKNAKAYGGTYTPVPGILIFFSKGHKLTDPSHVGIVTKVTSTYVYTVEGNTSDAVHERKYLLMIRTSSDMVCRHMLTMLKQTQKIMIPDTRPLRSRKATRFGELQRSTSDLDRDIGKS